MIWIGYICAPSYYPRVGVQGGCMQSGHHAPVPKALPISGLISLGGPGFMLMAKELGWTLPFPIVLLIGIASIISLSLSVILSIVWGWRWLKEQRDPNSLFNAIRIAARRNVIPIVLAAVAIVGLLLICVAGVGAYYHYANQTKVAGDQKPGSDPAHEQKPLKRMLTAYDVERRQRALDELLDSIDKAIAPESRAGDEIRLRFFDKVGNKTAINELDAFAAALKKSLDAYFDLANRNQQFSDIWNVAHSWQIHPNTAVESSLLLRAELQEMVQRGQIDQARDYLKNNKLLADWIDALQKLHQWISQKKTALIEKRREYEQAEVYPFNKTELPAPKTVTASPRLEYQGEPIGFAQFSWRSGRNQHQYGLPSFQAKNVSKEEVLLRDIVFVSKRNGERLPTRLVTWDGQQIPPAKAELIQPEAEFQVSAEYPAKRDGPAGVRDPDRLLPLTDIMNGAWGQMYITVECGADKRYTVDVSGQIEEAFNLIEEGIRLTEQRSAPPRPGIKSKA